jgi:hypothetical protein
MDDRTLRELLERISALEQRSVRYRQGVITDTSPLSVALGGSDVSYESVKQLEGTVLAVDDVVAVLTFGNDLLVLGKLA